MKYEKVEEKLKARGISLLLFARVVMLLGNFAVEDPDLSRFRTMQSDGLHHQSSNLLFY